MHLHDKKTAQLYQLGICQYKQRTPCIYDNRIASTYALYIFVYVHIL